MMPIEIHIEQGDIPAQGRCLTEDEIFPMQPTDDEFLTQVFDHERDTGHLVEITLYQNDGDSQETP